MSNSLLGYFYEELSFKREKEELDEENKYRNRYMYFFVLLFILLLICSFFKKNSILMKIR